MVANYVIKEHTECHKDELPLAWKTVRNAMLKDNVLEAVQTVEEVRETIHQLVELHQRAGMSLGKWASSHESVQEGLESTEHAKGVDLYHVEACDLQRPILRALGMVWDTGSDLFCFDTAGEDPWSSLASGHHCQEPPVALYQGATVPRYCGCTRAVGWPVTRGTCGGLVSLASKPPGPSYIVSSALSGSREGVMAAGAACFFVMPQSRHMPHASILGLFTGMETLMYT